MKRITLCGLLFLLIACLAFSQSLDDPNGDPVYRTRTDGFADFFRNRQKSAAGDTLACDVLVGDSIEGDYVADAAFFDGGAHLLVTNSNTDNVSVIEWASRTVIADIPVGDFPLKVAVAGRNAFVSCLFADAVYVINLDSMAVSAIIPTGVQPNQIRFSADTTTAYVACDISNTCEIIDVGTLTHLATIPNFPSALSTFSFITSNNRSSVDFRHFEVTPDNQYLMVQDSTNSGLAFYNTNTGTLDTLLPGITNIRDLKVSPDSNQLVVWTSNSPPEAIQVDLSALTTKVVPLTGLSANTLCKEIAINPDGMRAYVSLTGLQSAIVDFADSSITTFNNTGPFWIAESWDHRYAIGGGFRTGIVDLATKTLQGQWNGLIQAIGVASDGDYTFAGIDPLRFEAWYAFDFTTPTNLQYLGDMYPGSPLETDAPARVAVTPDGSQIITADLLSHTATFIDSAGKQVSQILPLGDDGRAVAVTSDGRWALIATYDAATVHVVDLQTNTIATTLNVGNRPAVISISPNDSIACVANVSSNTVSIIALSGPFSTVLANVPVGTIGVSWTSLGIFSEVEISPQGDYALVASSFDDEIKVIDLNLNLVSQTLPAGDFPLQIAFADDGMNAAVVNKNDDTFTLLERSGNSYAVLGTYPAGDNPTRIAYDPVNDQFAICANGDQRVNYFDARTAVANGGVAFGPDHTPIQVLYHSGNNPAYLLATSVSGVAHQLRFGGKTFDLPAAPAYMANSRAAGTIAVAMPGPDYVTIMTMDTVVNVRLDEPLQSGPAFEVYPQPVREAAHFRPLGPIAAGTLLLEVFDVSGKLADRQSVDGSGAFAWRRGALTGGIYTYRISGDGQVLQSGKLLLR